MTQPSWKVFYWDFFGPHAEGTARHFKVHLDEFLTRERLEGCQAGTSSEGANHYAAWCKAPQALEKLIQQALRPKRVLEVEGDEEAMDV